MKKYFTKFVNRWRKRPAAQAGETAATSEKVTESTTTTTAASSAGTTAETVTETVVEKSGPNRNRAPMIAAGIIAIAVTILLALAFLPGVRETRVARTIRFWEKAPAPAPAVQPGQLASEMDEQRQAQSQDISAVTIDANTIEALGVETALVETREVDEQVRTTGRIAPDERRVTNVHTKIEGWIDQTYGNFEGQRVSKGQPLFTIYSPELVATQQEYLIALRARGDFSKSEFDVVKRSGKSLVEATRRRLELFDVTPQQINRVERTGRIEKNVTFYAPASGYVMERKAFPGMRITPDTQLYMLADLSKVFVFADIFESDLANVGVGSVAEVALPNGDKRTGRVEYVNPVLVSETRTAQARIELENPRLQLKPGMFVGISFRVVKPPQIVIPRDSVIATGTRHLVLVDDGSGNFKLQEITIGGQLGGSYIVQEGLAVGQRVARNIQFLIDSETPLRQAIESQGGSTPPGSPSGGMKDMPGMPGM